MAALLNHGETSFLSFKLAIGAVAAYVLYRFAEIPMARRGMKVALGVYIVLMGVHVVTGFTALGWQAPATVLTYFVNLPEAFLSHLS